MQHKTNSRKLLHGRRETCESYSMLGRNEIDSVSMFSKTRDLTQSYIFYNDQLSVLIIYFHSFNLKLNWCM